MRQLPTGTVTFLFSDIEGSTRLLDELGAAAYAEALAEHRRLLREAFAATGGVEVDTQGDAFFVAFPSAREALAAAAQAQAALAAGPIRVRMGIHSGEPLLTEEGYVGIDVHRGARVMSAGHGGQVLISHATYALLDNESGLVELGRHRLKDLTEPQPLYQLGEGEFPPLKTLNQTNLPVQPTPLVGREAELGELLGLLGGARLVTLTGAGGSGKTRLALQAAAELVEEYGDGVWWVSLAALRDPELVEPTMAQAVGAKDGLVDHLRNQKALILVDNFEHLLAAAPRIASLLAEAPELRILATSRERLAIAAEHEFPVPTLVPAEALALFTARARQLKPGFEPDEHASEICRRLDGLPLAIELAAARVKVLRPEQILERLGQSLELLTAGGRDAPERQRTLRATIEWSYELLSEDERELFAHLAVFAGSFDVETAEAVCEAELDTIASLVDKSLLRQTEDGRFFMLETILEYAAERLEGGVEAGQMRRRHAEHFLELAEAEEARLVGTEEATASRRLREDLPNLRAALETAIAADDAETALRLAGALHPFWYLGGHFVEGRGWAERALSLDGTPTQREKALAAAGECALHQGATAEARRHFEERLAICAGLGDLQRLGSAYTLLGHVASAERDFARALELYERSLLPEGQAFERTTVWHSRGSALNNMGWALLNLGRLEEAEMRFEEAVRTGEQEGAPFVVRATLNNLARVALARRDADGLRRCLADSLPLFGEEPELRLLAETFDLLARLCWLEQRPEAVARAAGGAERVREIMGVETELEQVPDVEWLVAAREAIGSQAWEIEVTRGRAAVDDDPLQLAANCLD
jgi:predicted ATPase/class 3 adenylate cyclase